MGEQLIIEPRVTVGFVLAVLLAAGFAAFAVYWLLTPGLINDGRRSALTNRIAALFCILLGGGYAVLNLNEMFGGGAAYVLNETQFAQRPHGPDQPHRWDAVSEFRVVPSDDPEEQMFSWIYQPKVIKFNSRAHAPAGAPPSCCVYTMERLWGRSSEEIARALNEWRAKALARSKR